MVKLSHVHASTMNVHIGENVRASQRIQKLKWVCYSLLRSIYLWHECMFAVSCGVYNMFVLTLCAVINVYRSRRTAPVCLISGH